MNFLEFAEKILTEENKPLSQNKIWEIGKAKYDKIFDSEDLLNKKGLK